LGTTIQTESKRIGKATKRAFRDGGHPYSSSHQQYQQQHQYQERTMHQQANSSSKFQVLTDICTAAAVIGGGILLAKGNRGAGATLLATGGVALVAGEAMRDARRQDSGLNENLGLHMN
jgi:hypothetical protein